ncbi:MAG: hypothetical protein ACXWL2_01760 [Candidatus Chromulinivorax sp.]
MIHKYTYIFLSIVFYHTIFYSGATPYNSMPPAMFFPGPLTIGYSEDVPNSWFEKNAQPFTPFANSAVNSNAPYNKNGLTGYFWNIPDTDNSFLYPGKARIGNDQYINVVAVDAKMVDNSDNPDVTVAIDSHNVNDIKQQSNKKFHPDPLVQIGTFIKQKDGTVYILFGAYEKTVIPDPKEIERMDYPDDRNIIASKHPDSILVM